MRSIRIYFENFFKWSCIRVCHIDVAYFLSPVTAFSELAHKCSYHCELHTIVCNGLELSTTTFALLILVSCAG